MFAEAVAGALLALHATPAGALAPAALALAVVVVAAAAGFGGPAGSWLITGIGLCAVGLGTAAFTAWQQRRSVVRP